MIAAPDDRFRFHDKRAQMSSSIFGRIEAGGRALAPFISSVAIILVGMTFSSFPGFGRISPCFGLMATYYWAIHRPDLLPLSATFALGLLTDLLSAAPAGMHALIYILVQWILVTQRRFFLGNTFLLLWWGFALIATAADVLEMGDRMCDSARHAAPLAPAGWNRIYHRSVSALRMAVHAGAA